MLQNYTDDPRIIPSKQSEKTIFLRHLNLKLIKSFNICVSILKLIFKHKNLVGR